MADDAGAMLVQSGLVTASALDAARAQLDDAGGTLGEHLVAAGAITDAALTDFYRQRLLVPMVNPNALAQLSAKVVATIPSDMAIELRAVPVSLDADNNLTVAMSDPADRHAVDEIAWFTGAYVVRAIATQMQIAWCLAHYYGHVTVLGQRLMQPGEPVATGTPPTPPPMPSQRKRGFTAKVNATRHRALAPITHQVAVQRPNSAALDDATPGAPTPTVAPLPVPPPLPPTPTPETETAEGAPAHRARSASGEIRMPRAASVKPPLPDESGPVITIEVSDDLAQTGPRKLPKRRVPAKTDPPELAARAGELHAETGPIRRVELDTPSIVISADATSEVSADAVRAAATAEAAEAADAAGAAAEPAAADDALATVAPTRDSAPITVTREEDLSAPVIIHSHVAVDSAPILLERKAADRDDAGGVPLAAAPAAAPDDDFGGDTDIGDEPGDRGDGDEVVMLDAPKRAARPRRERKTQVGFGAAPVALPPRAHRDTEAEPAPAAPEPVEAAAPSAPFAVPAAVIDDAPTTQMAASPDADGTATQPVAVVTAADRDADGEGRDADGEDRDADGEDRDADGEDRDADGEDRDTEQRAAVPSNDVSDEYAHVRSAPSIAAALTAVAEQPATRRRRRSSNDVDHGWTSPPPLTAEAEAAPAAAPAAMIAPEATPAPTRVVTTARTATGIAAIKPAAPAVEPSDGTAEHLIRELEASTSRAVDTVRRLDGARTRDDVIAVLVSLVSTNHRRAGLFAVRPLAPEAGGGRGAAELALFSIMPRAASIPGATVRLDRASALRDIVHARQLFRGPLADEPSQTFLGQVFGAAPPEILLVPLSVRERVVAVVFGEGRYKPAFDDQLGVAARAGGLALERILARKR